MNILTYCLVAVKKLDGCLKITQSYYYLQPCNPVSEDVL